LEAEAEWAGEEKLGGSAEGVGVVNQFVMKAELNNGILLFVLESSN
jgi:hypothetical protein